MQLIKKF